MTNGSVQDSRKTPFALAAAGECPFAYLITLDNIHLGVTEFLTKGDQCQQTIDPFILSSPSHHQGWRECRIRS